jgi:predicted O-methyltransferase YrrM
MAEQWNKEALHGLSTAFQECRILLSATQLDLFSKLKDSPKSVAELCQSEGWYQRGVRILMDALTGMGILFRTEDERYGVPDAISPLLAAGGEESIVPMILHRGRMWESWSHLTEIVRTGKNPNVFVERTRTPEEMEDFIGAMHVVGRELAAVIAKSVDLTRHKRLLDVGGGSGTYVMAFLREGSHLTGTLFDLPEVVEMARKRLTDEGFIDRVRIVAGDYNKDDLPPGHDLVLLSAVIHSLSREGNIALYRRIHQALEPGGTILIRDYFMDSTGTSPVGGTIFGVNMLAATSGGDSHRYEDVKEDLETAGFSDVRMIREGDNMDQLVSAVK